MDRDQERKPTHPGELIREDLLPETGITQTELATLMGVSFGKGV
jgi:antitoxin HigA-1